MKCQVFLIDMSHKCWGGQKSRKVWTSFMDSPLLAISCVWFKQKVSSLNYFVILRMYDKGGQWFCAGSTSVAIGGGFKLQSCPWLRDVIYGRYLTELIVCWNISSVFFTVRMALPSKLSRVTASLKCKFAARSYKQSL